MCNKIYVDILSQYDSYQESVDEYHRLYEYDDGSKVLVVNANSELKGKDGYNITIKGCVRKEIFQDLDKYIKMAGGLSKQPAYEVACPDNAELKYDFSKKYFYSGFSEYWKNDTKAHFEDLGKVDLKQKRMDKRMETHSVEAIQGKGEDKQMQQEANKFFFKRSPMLTEKQNKFAYAIEKWAWENNIRNKQGYLLSFNRNAENVQTSFKRLIERAKEYGFVEKTQVKTSLKPARKQSRQENEFEK